MNTGRILFATWYPQESHNFSFLTEKRSNIWPKMPQTKQSREKRPAQEYGEDDQRCGLLHDDRSGEIGVRGRHVGKQSRATGTYIISPRQSGFRSGVDQRKWHGRHNLTR